MPYYMCRHPSYPWEYIGPTDMQEYADALLPINDGAPLSADPTAGLPEAIKVGKPPRGAFPDFCFCTGIMPAMVSERVMDAINDLEPGVHRFFPTKLVYSKSDEPAPPRFLLYNTSATECVLIDESQFPQGKGRAGFELGPTISEMWGAVLSKKAIAGRHLWRHSIGPGKKFIPSPPFRWDVFCSEEFKRRMDGLGVEGIHYIACETR